MFTRGFYYLGISKNVTLINLCPGMINTKMLVEGFGAVGQDIIKATNTYQLAVRDEDANPLGKPRFYVGLKERKVKPMADDTDSCQILFKFLTGLI